MIRKIVRRIDDLYTEMYSCQNLFIILDPVVLTVLIILLFKYSGLSPV